MTTILDPADSDSRAGLNARNEMLPGFRLVTLCGSSGSMHDAMRDTQDILEPLFTGRGVDVRPVDIGDWSARAVPQLRREILRHQPHAILTQYPTGAFGHSLAPILLGLINVAPTMVMLHEFAAAHILRKAAVGGLLLRAARIGVTAEREAKQLLRFYPWLAGRFRHVPIASNIPGRPWCPTLPPRVVYFGQLRPNKGIEEFIACRDKIAAAFPEAVFQIIGAVLPTRQDYANELINLGRQRDIQIVCDLDIAGVSHALSEATVALLPFPDGASMRRGSMFAAAACGVPIVTTTGPDTPPELNPYIEPASTVDDLVGLTLAYLRDEAVRMNAHRLSMMLDSQIGFKQTVDAYIRVFRELPAAEAYAISSDTLPSDQGRE